MLPNFIWLGFGNVESRLSQNVSRRVKIVASKDRTHADSKPVLDQVTVPNVLMSSCDALFVQYMSISENWSSKMNFFFINFEFKNGYRNNFNKKKTSNHAADRKIGFSTKLISKPYGRATAMPPAWELSEQE